MRQGTEKKTAAPGDIEMYNYRWLIGHLPGFLQIQLQGFSWMHVALLAAAGIVGFFLLLYIFRGTRGRRLDGKLLLTGSLMIICVSVILEITVFRRSTAGDGVIHGELYFGSLHTGYAEAERFVYSVLNVLLFVPFGMAYRLLRCGGRYVYLIFMTALTGFCFSFLIEISQLLLAKGYFELVDIVCNTTGGVIGAVPVSVCMLLLRMLRGEKNGN